MLETISSISLLTAMEILGPILLAAAMVYAIMGTKGRSAAEKARTDEGTRLLYKVADRQEKSGTD